MGKHVCCMKNWLKSKIHGIVVNGENIQLMNLRNNQNKCDFFFTLLESVLQKVELFNLLVMWFLK